MPQSDSLPSAYPPNPVTSLLFPQNPPGGHKKLLQRAKKQEIN